MQDQNVNGSEPQVSEDIGQVDKTQRDIPTEMTLECGAVLAIKKPSTMLLSRVMESVQKDDPSPKVPTVYIKDKERDEENPNDPDYRAALAVWNANAVMRMFNALVVSCLTIKELNEAYDPYGEDFEDFLVAVELEPTKGKLPRFLQWIQTYALVKEESRQLTEWMMALAGVTEEDVAEATSFLQGDTKLSTHPVPSA